jgi:hypothetical protein
VKYVDSLLVYNQLVNPYTHHTWDVREVFPEPAVIIISYLRNKKIVERSNKRRKSKTS